MHMVASLPLSLCRIGCAVREKAENRTPSTQSELRAQPFGSTVYVHLNIYFGNGSVCDSAGGGFVLHVQSPGFEP